MCVHVSCLLGNMESAKEEKCVCVQEERCVDDCDWMFKYVLMLVCVHHGVCVCVCVCICMWVCQCVGRKVLRLGHDPFTQTYFICP